MENSDANEIIAAARGYIGTPFVHQGRQPHVGMDCIGVIIEINKARGEPYDRTNYGRLPHRYELETALNRLFVRVDRALQLADIILFEWPSGRQHVGLYTGDGVIHAYESGRRYGRRAGAVVEHPLGRTWQRLIKAVYTWRD